MQKINWIDKMKNYTLLLFTLLIISWCALSSTYFLEEGNTTKAQINSPILNESSSKFPPYTKANKVKPATTKKSHGTQESNQDAITNKHDT